MILIADSGGTKTEWGLITSNGSVKKYSCKGLNPYLANQTEFNTSITSGFTEEERKMVARLFFYTAGGNSDYMNNVIVQYLSPNFPNASIVVQSDIVGAANALFGKKSGYIGLLGTGSGWAWYDGVDIRNKISGMGYILGDEGSGSDLGKILIKDAYRGDMPTHLRNKFVAKYHPPEILIRNLYDAPNKAHYLAKFATFIHENLHDDYMYELVYQRFGLFVSLLTDKNMEPGLSNIGFVGSIAHSFQSVLIPVLSSKGIRRPNIMKSPLEALIKYHLNHGQIYR